MLRYINRVGPLALQSDYAREQDVNIGVLSSLGLITSLDTVGRMDYAPTRQWRLTSWGASVVETL